MNSPRLPKIIDGRGTASCSRTAHALALDQRQPRRDEPRPGPEFSDSRRLEDATVLRTIPLGKPQAVVSWPCRRKGIPGLARRADGKGEGQENLYLDQSEGAAAALARGRG